MRRITYPRPGTTNRFDAIGAIDEALQGINPGVIVRATKGITIIQDRVELPRTHTHLKLLGQCLHEYAEQGFILFVVEQKEATTDV